MRQARKPHNALTVATFKELEEFVNAFDRGTIRLLLIVGGPGLQKSRIVKECVKDARVIEGHATPFGIYEELWRTITQGNVFRTELTNRRKDGSLYMVDIIITPLKDKAGEINGFAGIERDIT